MASPFALRTGELKIHALLRMRDARGVRLEAPPAWVGESLARAPWVVVRRAFWRDGLVPVGVRGELREQRFAALVAVEDVLECVTPRELVRRRAWGGAACARLAAVPALAVLDEVERVMEDHGLGAAWGPGGSVGFELASGVATATAGSDLDLVIEVGRLEALAGRGARALWEALAELPVRVDALLEASDGAVVLSEYTRAHTEGGSFVLRTAAGPRLIRATTKAPAAASTVTTPTTASATTTLTPAMSATATTGAPAARGAPATTAAMAATAALAATAATAAMSAAAGTAAAVGTART